jgi:plastocyanin
MRFTALALVVVATTAVIGACDDDEGGTTGGAGTTVQAQGTAGTTGSAGTSAAGSTGSAGTTGAAGTGAAQQFTAIEPCLAEADYVSGTAIAVSPTAIGYSPACLKIAAGTTITIGASTFHPLTGTDLGTAGNPIPEHQTATTTVSFPSAGFYSFECDTHAIVGMKGVVWVTP